MGREEGREGGRVRRVDGGRMWRGKEGGRERKREKGGGGKKGGKEKGRKVGGGKEGGKKEGEKKRGRKGGGRNRRGEKGGGGGEFERVSSVAVRTSLHSRLSPLLSLQLQCVLKTVEFFERYKLSKRYLKYKPALPLVEDRKAWWRYAITAVLEEDVKRKTRMWSWKHMKQHRSVDHMILR